MASATETNTGSGMGGNVQMTVAILFGAVLALVGVLGPVLGGANNDLIIFGRNYLHDGVHLLSGLAGLAAGYVAGGEYAGEYNKALGVTYLLVTILGFALGSLMTDLLAINFADNVLHLVLAVAFLAVGFALGES